MDKSLRAIEEESEKQQQKKKMNPRNWTLQ